MSCANVRFLELGKKWIVLFRFVEGKKLSEKWAVILF